MNEPPLDAGDARRLGRLLARTLGRGFKLVIIESRSPTARAQMEAWVASCGVEPGPVVVSVPFPEVAANVWAGLSERLASRSFNASQN